MKIKLTTLALFAAGLLAGLTLIAPATGADPPATTTTTATVYGSASGAIAVLSATSITVNDLTCTRTSSSPSLDGYKVGDQVGLGCANGVMIVIVDKRPAATTTTTTTTTTAVQGAGARDPISALSATSITVGPLTCALGPSSPSVPFKVGDRVKIGCLGGVLAYVIADNDVPTTTAPSTAPPEPTTTTAAVVTRGGTLTAIGEHTLTVDGLTCYVYPSSPTVTGFKVGDRVGVACQSNVLIKIVALGDEPKPSDGVIPKIGVPPSDDRHDELQTRLGAITALSTSSITVDSLTCSVGASSPSVTGFKLGDNVGIGCANGVLVKIGVPQNDDGGFRVTVQLGRIAVLSGGSITVGPLTCRLAATSPSVASYEVGDRVGIGCAGEILFMIGALPSPDSTPKLEVKHALVRHFNGCIKRGAERCLVAGVLRRLAHKK
jgi:hypothetical protein